MSLKPVIDHAVINVDGQLDAACALFRRLGFQLTPRGHHSMGSSNHLAIFGENYLELLGYEPDSAPGKRGFWHVPPGLAGLVWKTTDASEAYSALQQCGLDGEPPTRFSRPVELPDGRQTEAAFCITRLNAAAIPYGFSFFCQHLTPDAVWQDDWREHANGVQALTEFVIASPTPDETISLYARLFSAPTEQEPGGGRFLRTGESRLRVITPRQASETFGLTGAALATPCMAALAFRVASLARLMDHLASAGIHWQRTENRVVVSAAQTGLVALSFSE